MEENIESVEEWVNKLDIETTKDIHVPKLLFDQVIGQDQAGEIVKKAALQRRHVILIGEPGTGKSMLAQSMVDFLPKSELEDILVFPNPEDPNKPKIKTVPAGKGKEIVRQYQIKAEREKRDRSRSIMFVIFSVVLLGIIAAIVLRSITLIFFAIMAAAFLYMAMAFNPVIRNERAMVPKLLVSHNPNDKPPFVDSTGAHSGALLGDVRHDPFQSGGLETPAHERVEAGNIHKAHKGVLFIDEINLLRPEDQQAILTALQEKKYPISGQSERSAGAMVQTEPVPCDFVLVAAGNYDAIRNMHPALRSRIRGYGYEVVVNDYMDDNDENRRKLVQFIAQEVEKDKKIPHFDKSAIIEVIKEAQKRSGRRNKLTLRLRELGGLVRVAGDIAVSQKKTVVTAADVIAAKNLAKPLEQQIADRSIEIKKIYKTFRTEGSVVGMVNGLAVVGADTGMSEYTGVVLPIVAEVTPAEHKGAGNIIATGKLGDIAKEAVLNVSAVFKKLTGKDISNMDIHIQFVGTYEGVEGDSASVSIATAVISAIENIPVDQSVAMTGSLSVRGDVLPVGGVTAKVEAAIEAGLNKVIVPELNYSDIILDADHVNKIEIIPAKTIEDVLRVALVNSPEKEKLFDRISNLINAAKIIKPQRPATPATTRAGNNAA
ncbi:ATP-dependent proteinase La (Lon) related protein [Thermoplasma acidophilum]|uniref:Archaeal Lon protease n=1 Tax=Thermoplasma acidophilum (strain ATCC 25905 / DSM 1728 / JCM 9062 / NBRC 15155 / AMRC-C165) TaxID=273075 RepID=LONB_THEAC|nr:ATP-dependent protease LonB [Thermoplasma acidophilum]Q9HJ89.1 RecName: Full=Archaeal Lon protease; AltName: Full=ATP-dependent protease La homolog [Thermoplasma acidophilum DSM 1728]MCY0851814.1 ATP-dependent protease LonB [Thermoplasma acidophilum]CAC12209.1 ATP-dependent proteinase La (Lon) related protein [Thermoplasma acidophilum]